MTFGEIIAIACGSGGLSAGLNVLATQWQARAERDRDMLHQTLVVAEHLENYAFGCAGHAFGDWRILVREEAGALLSQPPDFPPFSDKIVWQSVDARNAAEARTMAGKVELALAATQAGFGRGAVNGYATALSWTLRLGNEAFQSAAYLRSFAGIAPLTFDTPRWDYPLFLRGELDKLELRKEQIAAHVAARIASAAAEAGAKPAAWYRSVGAVARAFAPYLQPRRLAAEENSP